MTEGRPRPSREELERLYWDEGKNQKEIGDIYGVIQTSVSKWLTNYGINRRDRSEVQLRRGFKKPSKEELRKLFLQDGKSQKVIAEMLNVNEMTLRKWLRKEGIKRKTWKTEEEWRQYGIQQGFAEIYASDIRKGNDTNSRSWYGKGGREGWLNSFEFKKKMHRGRWVTEEEWRQYGLDNGYDEKRASELEESETLVERSWYKRGLYKKWTKNFPLNITRKPAGYLKNWENVEREILQAIEENNGDFPSQRRLAKLGRSSLAAAIGKYHGGFLAVRERMGYNESGFSTGENPGNPLERILTGYVEEEAA